MVAMHVGDKNPRDLADLEIAAQKLMLSPLAAVKQPNFSPLGQPQGNARDVPSASGHAGTGSKKRNLHGWVSLGCKAQALRLYTDIPTATAVCVCCSEQLHLLEPH